MTGLVLGIDPGISGALAFYNEDVLTVHDMPTTTRIVNGSKKQAVEPYQLASIIELHRHAIDKVVVEQVSAMPARARFPGGPVRGMGATSAFSFGTTYGMILGVVAAVGLPVITVVPVVWKRKFGLLGQGKDASRAEASRRLPRWADLWPLKKHDGRAEAALLALYGSSLS